MCMCTHVFTNTATHTHAHIHITNNISEGVVKLKKEWVVGDTISWVQWPKNSNLS